MPLPFLAVFHDENVYPARVGNDDDTVNVESVWAVEADGGDTPPFESYVTGYVLASHTAYSTTLTGPIVKVEPEDRSVPDPFAAVFQRWKV